MVGTLISISHFAIIYIIHEMIIVIPEWGDIQAGQ